jgi:tRNA(adenine34) deaminase
VPIREVVRLSDASRCGSFRPSHGRFPDEERIGTVFAFFTGATKPYSAPRGILHHTLLFCKERNNPLFPCAALDSDRDARHNPRIMFDSNVRYMEYAIREARAALEHDEVPVGCVIVHENRIVGKAHNMRETLQDPTAHAEVLAITQAAAALQSWRLEGAKLYVTLEPCPMCAGAIILSRVAEVYFGAFDPKAGACGTLMNLLEDKRFNHQPKVTSGLLADECAALLTDFFRNIRRRGT